MTGLRDAIGLQTRALAELERARGDAAAWDDEQRQSLDRQCLDPLTADGRRVLEALRKAARELAAAQAMISR